MSWKVTLTLKCGHPCSSQDNLILMSLWWNSLPELTMVMMSVDHKNDDNANEKDDEVVHPCPTLDNLILMIMPMVMMMKLVTRALAWTICKG